ncbi:MAG: c-type cytochrome biogenesis protein CcmI [Alphaproteobacteria bacterium]|nr:c-type cytochrome biogenesis protein CcmI [Alphaproteobacteria bacterium]
MSIGLLVALIGMTSLAMAILLVPLLLRQRGEERREAYNLAVYQDQLAEVERDVERGVLSAEQAEAARIEISRRMLALAPAAASPRRASAVPLGATAAAVVMLPFAALAIYAALGAPNVPDQPFASRGEGGAAPVASGAPPHIDMAQAVAQLTDHLKKNPGDLQSWLLLGRSQISLGRFQDAADSYRRAADLSAQRPDVVGDYGEALVLAAGGTVTPPAHQAFETGLQDPETAPRSRYYIALAELQHGNTRAALQSWVDLEADSPSDADWLPLLRRRIADAAASIGVDPASFKPSAGAGRTAAAAEAAPAPADKPAAQMPSAQMPSAKTVAEAARAIADASPQDRQAMIHAMVDRLASQLEQRPDDGDGWVRLGRSYMVLNEPEKARDAYARAVRLKPDSVELKLAYAEAIIAASGDAGASPPPEIPGLMRDVLRADPQNREALWYVGIAEAEAGHAQAALDLWNKLLAQLPQGAPERQAVEQRIAALKPTPAR